MSVTRDAYLSIVGKTLQFRYTNWQMETEMRHATVLAVWYGHSEFHTGPQWFMQATCLDRQETRNFAMRDMTEVSVV